MQGPKQEVGAGAGLDAEGLVDPNVSKIQKVHDNKSPRTQAKLHRRQQPPPPTLSLGLALEQTLQPSARSDLGADGMDVVGATNATLAAAVTALVSDSDAEVFSDADGLIEDFHMALDIPYVEYRFTASDDMGSDSD